MDQKPNYFEIPNKAFEDLLQGSITPSEFIILAGIYFNLNGWVVRGNRIGNILENVNYFSEYTSEDKQKSGIGIKIKDKVLQGRSIKLMEYFPEA